MPGILGNISKAGPAACLSQALATLRHTPDACSEEVNVNAGINLGSTSLRQKSTWHFDPSLQVGVMFTGTIFSGTSSTHVVDSEELLKLYASSGFTRWASFEGGFTIALVDLRSRNLFIYNDRLGSLPLIHARTASTFCFAPEAKALFMMANGPRPKLSTEGAIGFLTAGYPLGDRTMFENINYLEPATILRVDLDDLSEHYERYWNLHYEPQRSLKRTEAASALHDSIVDSCRIVLADCPEPFDLLLSGGLDSRGILGALAQLQRAPRRALTWGRDLDIARSDANVAKQMADSMGIPFSFYRYDTDSFIPNAPRWAYISELMNDNFGWYAEAPNVYEEFYNQGGEFLLVGDEIWGWGNSAGNRDQAIEAVLPAELLSPMHEVLRPGIRSDVKKAYRAQIQRVLERCNNTDFNDVKDYLYLNIRVARFIFSIGYYKEIATELRRPFLTDRTIEVIRHLPSHLRLDKAAYITMLRRHMPQVMAQPWASVSSLPDWSYQVRADQQLRRYLLGLLDFDRVQTSPLGELLDRNKFEKLRDNFFATPVARGNRRFSRRKYSLTTLRRVMESASPQLGHLTSKLKRVFVRKHRQNSTFHFLRRVALCTLLQENLHLFENTGEPRQVNLQTHDGASTV